MEHSEPVKADIFGAFPSRPILIMIGDRGGRAGDGPTVKLWFPATAQNLLSPPLLTKSNARFQRIHSLPWWGQTGLDPSPSWSQGPPQQQRATLCYVLIIYNITRHDTERKVFFRPVRSPQILLLRWRTFGEISLLHLLHFAVCHLSPGDDCWKTDRKKTLRSETNSGRRRRYYTMHCSCADARRRRRRRNVTHFCVREKFHGRARARSSGGLPLLLVLPPQRQLLTTCSYFGWCWWCCRRKRIMKMLSAETSQKTRLPGCKKGARRYFFCRKLSIKKGREFIPPPRKWDKLTIVTRFQLGCHIFISEKRLLLPILMYFFVWWCRGSLRLVSISTGPNW